MNKTDKYAVDSVPVGARRLTSNNFFWFHEDGTHYYHSNTENGTAECYELAAQFNLTKGSELVATYFGVSAKAAEAANAVDEDSASKLFAAIGWAHAECCAMLDKGIDPRKVAVTELIVRAKADLGDLLP